MSVGQPRLVLKRALLPKMMRGEMIGLLFMANQVQDTLINNISDPYNLAILGLFRFVLLSSPFLSSSWLIIK